MNKEIWKDIVGYEGLYQVSNQGNVRSLTREHIQFNHNVNCKVKYKGKMLKPNTQKGTGYLTYTLYNKNKKGKVILVHRLVAINFLDNKDNCRVVNHIDGDKTNNCVENLEWCTQSHNVKEAYRLGFAKGKQLTGTENHRARQISQYDLNNNFIRNYEYIKDASEQLKIDASSISSVCKGKRKTAGGYIWKYKQD